MANRKARTSQGRGARPSLGVAAAAPDPLHLVYTKTVLAAGELGAAMADLERLDDVHDLPHLAVDDVTSRAVGIVEDLQRLVLDIGLLIDWIGRQGAGGGA